MKFELKQKNEVIPGIDPKKWGTKDKPIFEAPEDGRYDFYVGGRLCICILKRGQRILIDYSAGRITYLDC